MFNIFCVWSTTVTFWRRSILRQRMDSEYVFIGRRIEEEYSSAKKDTSNCFEKAVTVLDDEYLIAVGVPASI